MDMDLDEMRRDLANTRTQLALARRERDEARAQLAALQPAAPADERLERAEQLGRGHAADASAAGGSDPTDSDGECLLPVSPMDADWVTLRRDLPDPTDGELDAYERAYRAVMAVACAKYEAGG